MTHGCSMIKIKDVQCRSLLNRSGIPGIDYGINPYTGCAHKCQYCYAVFMKKFTKHSEPWGDFVDVKVNAPGVLEKQLRRLKISSAINFGTVCDAYQPIESKYRITRSCLEILQPYKHSVSVLTKSPLVTRDLDILQRLHESEVGFTITTIDRDIKRVFEPRTMPVQKVFTAIKTLADHGINTWVFVAPILPGITDSAASIRTLIKSSQNAEARYIMFDVLNPYPKVWQNITRLAAKHFPDAKKGMLSYKRDPAPYRNRLGNLIRKISLDFLIPRKITFGC